MMENYPEMKSDKLKTQNTKVLFMITYQILDLLHRFYNPERTALWKQTEIDAKE